MTMADPAETYDTCALAGLTTPKSLGVAPLDISVASECFLLASTQAAAPGDLRVSMTTTFAGSVAPPGTVGDVFAGPADPTYWPTQSTKQSTGTKIYLPDLPIHSTRHPSSAGFMMPAWAGTCRVFFPGTYDDPVTISDSIPTYFASGIYYFTEPITLTGSANVVVGGGTTEGCTNDQDAAYFAVNGPAVHNVSGYGATFIFGAAGRLVVDDTIVNGSGVSLVMNNRLVGTQEVTAQASAGVSIMTVNGVLAGGAINDLSIPGTIFVPETKVNNGLVAEEATTNAYTPSALVPTSLLPAPGTNVVTMRLVGDDPSTVRIDGYVSVPQGSMSVEAAAATAANKSLVFSGGVLAAMVHTTADLPATTTLGLVNRVVQHTFKIVSETTSGVPKLTSVATVKINEYGKYTVVNWEVQS
jgi:hypothetical protein